MQLLAVALMKPRHLVLRTLETHGTVELHEPQSCPHVERIGQGWRKQYKHLY